MSPEHLCPSADPAQPFEAFHAIDDAQSGAAPVS